MREQRTGDDLAELGVRDLLVDLLPVARIGAEHGLGGPHDKRGVVAPEPGEVADVLRVGDEDAVHAEPLEQRAAAVETRAHLAFPPLTSSASAASAST